MILLPPLSQRCEEIGSIGHQTRNGMRHGVNVIEARVLQPDQLTSLLLYLVALGQWTDTQTTSSNQLNIIQIFEIAV